MRKIVASLALSGSLVAGGVAGALLGVPALSGAQTDDGTSAASGPARGDKQGRVEGVLDRFVADGTISQDTADKIAAALREEMVRRGPKHGLGHGGPKLDAAARALGMTVEELASELRSGKTLAEVAADKGVDVGAVIDALVAEATARIDAAVETGKLDQAKADELKTGLRERVSTMVNEGRPGPGGPGLHRGPGLVDGGPHPGADRPAGDHAASTTA